MMKSPFSMVLEGLCAAVRFSVSLDGFAGSLEFVCVGCRDGCGGAGFPCVQEGFHVFGAAGFHFGEETGFVVE